MSEKEYLLLGGPGHGRYVVHRGGPLYMSQLDEPLVARWIDDPEPSDYVNISKTVYYPHRTALRVSDGTGLFAVFARLLRHESLSPEQADMKYIQVVFRSRPEVQFERFNY